jgi:hypothetical protein
MVKLWPSRAHRKQNESDRSRTHSRSVFSKLILTLTLNYTLGLSRLCKLAPSLKIDGIFYNYSATNRYKSVLIPGDSNKKLKVIVRLFDPNRAHTKNSESRSESGHFRSFSRFHSDNHTISPFGNEKGYC